jgi:hypothetical protein
VSVVRDNGAAQDPVGHGCRLLGCPKLRHTEPQPKP